MTEGVDDARGIDAGHVREGERPTRVQLARAELRIGGGDAGGPHGDTDLLATGLWDRELVDREHVGGATRAIGTGSPANHDFLTRLGATAISYGPGLVARVAAALAAGGRFAIPLRAVFPLARGAEAHTLVAGGHGQGKVVLTVP